MSSDIKLNFDSKSGSFDISMNGNSVDNVSSFNYYTWIRQTENGQVKMGEVTISTKEGDNKNSHDINHSWVWEFNNEAEATYTQEKVSSAKKLMQVIGRRFDERK